jgi:hypothetical protein
MLYTEITIATPWFSPQVANNAAKALEKELSNYIRGGEQFPYLSEVLAKALRIALQTVAQLKKPEQFLLYDAQPDALRLSWRPHAPGKRSLGQLRWDIRRSIKGERAVELIYGGDADPGRIVIPQQAYPWGFRAKLLTGGYRSYRWEKVRTWHTPKESPYATAHLAVTIEMPPKRDVRKLRGMALQIAETFNRTERAKVKVQVSGYRMVDHLVNTWY